MDGPPAQSLGVEPVDKDVMSRSHHIDANGRVIQRGPVLDGTLFMRSAFAGFLIVIGTLFVYQVNFYFYFYFYFLC